MCWQTQKVRRKRLPNGATDVLFLIPKEKSTHSLWCCASSLVERRSVVYTDEIPYSVVDLSPRQRWICGAASVPTTPTLVLPIFQCSNVNKPEFKNRNASVVSEYLSKKMRRFAKLLLAMMAMMLIFTYLLDWPSYRKVDWPNYTKAEIEVEPPPALPLLPESYTLTDDTRKYFSHLPNGLSCFTEGTDMIRSVFKVQPADCTCKNGYYGRDCGIPEPVWLSCQSVNNCSDMKQREIPRRLIHGFNINHELEFFQVRLEEVGDVLDAIIVGESNLTAGGDPSQLYLLPELQKGFMRDYQHKIIHVLIGHFPPRGLTDGWFADTFIRDHMGKEGLKRIKGLRDDDIFLLLDADEIPDKSVLLFLKLYDGYPEPISLTLRWSVYGFFWKRFVSGSPQVEDVTRIVAVSTMKMIREVYDGNVMSIRRNYLMNPPLSSRVEAYRLSGHSVMEWNLGRIGAYAGFHCSWCYKPERIRLKLMSAQKDDKPRWGDYPEKLDLNYISGLIQSGAWFDNSKPFFLVKEEEDRHCYAPAYILKHRERFQYLLERSNTTSNSKL